MLESKNYDLPASLLAVGMHLCIIFHRRSFALRSTLLFCMFLKTFRQFTKPKVFAHFSLYGWSTELLSRLSNVLYIVLQFSFVTSLGSVSLSS